MRSAGTERERGNSFSIAMEEQDFERESPRVSGAEKGFRELGNQMEHSSSG
jgi:hypothetical protein